MNETKYTSISLYYLSIIVFFFAFLFPFVVSAKAPSIAILSPTPDSVISGDVDIEAKAKDNTGVTKVEFFIDGDLLWVDESPEMEGEWSYWSCQWDTTDNGDGYHIISAKATDTSGKTTIDRVSVLVKNEGNIHPTASIFYTSEGYKYYFYPYECDDPDGFIAKYQYTILKENNDQYSEISTYSCCDKLSFCETDNPLYSLCSEPCYFPDPSPGFCLFYSCPFICYEFDPPLGQNEEYLVTLEVWDNDGAASNIAERIITINSSGSANDMYIRNIVPQKKSTGSRTTLYLTVNVSYDSNANGTADPDDLPVSGALVEMRLYKDSDDFPDGHFDKMDQEFQIELESTNQNGEALFIIKGLMPGDYKAEAVGLTDPVPDRSLQWNNNLDGVNPRYIAIW